MEGDILLPAYRSTSDVIKLQPPLETVADLIVMYLEQLDIEYIFGIPGVALEPLYKALLKSERRKQMRHILTRHEAGAASMADGYARETGKIGVCCAASGAGATNLLTGVACAYDNNIPILVLTGQLVEENSRKSALQEFAGSSVNTQAMFQSCTVYNSHVSHPKQMETKLVSALQRAIRSPRGPAHLSIPSDILSSPSPIQRPSYDLQHLLTQSAMMDDDAMAELMVLLATARKTVLLLGGGCNEAIASILQFATRKNIAVITTPNGKGLVNPRHHLYHGVFGFAGHASANAILSDNAVDLILAVGTDMGEWCTGGWSDSLLNDRLVHIDESEENLLYTPMAKLHVCGRIQSIFNHLNAELELAEKAGEIHFAPLSGTLVGDALHYMVSEPAKYHSNAVPIKPQRLMRELGDLFPPMTRFLVDAGSSISWSVHYLHPKCNRRLGERRETGGERKVTMGRRRNEAGWLRLTTNFAAMGWAIGGAVGTAIANRHVPVVCITGDGSMLMNGQEISVAVAEKLGVIFVVLNDQSLGMVKHGQRLAGAEHIAYELPPTDFAMLARALGAQAFTIRSPDDIAQLDIAAICMRKGPTLLDVYVDPEEIPPIHIRMKTLMTHL